MIDDYERLFLDLAAGRLAQGDALPPKARARTPLGVT
jgi:hypothetical protein